MVPAVSHRHLTAEDLIRSWFNPYEICVFKNVALGRFFSQYLNFAYKYNSTNTHSLINFRRFITLVIESVLTYMQKEKKSGDMGVENK